MKTSKFSDSQIPPILKSTEAGAPAPVPELAFHVGNHIQSARGRTRYD
jgi:hypothetical protein